VEPAADANGIPGSKGILTSVGTVPLKRAMKSLDLPVKFGAMLKPVSSQPPIFLPSSYAMENFGAFLEAVGVDLNMGQCSSDCARRKKMAAGGRGLRTAGSTDLLRTDLRSGYRIYCLRGNRVVRHLNCSGNRTSLSMSATAL
jgi:hypothetical protein